MDPTATLLKTVTLANVALVTFNCVVGVPVCQPI